MNDRRRVKEEEIQGNKKTREGKERRGGDRKMKKRNTQGKNLRRGETR